LYNSASLLLNIWAGGWLFIALAIVFTNTVIISQYLVLLQIKQFEL